MVAALLLVAALQQGLPPAIDVELDRTHVVVGDEVTLTVRATSRSNGRLDVSLAPITGLAVVGRSERTEISYGPMPTRTTTLELRLRAVQSGRWEIGPVTARQGAMVETAPPVAVYVSENRATAVSPLPDGVRALAERAPPPERPGQPALRVVLSRDTVLVGEQVDLVTVAWFPRELRERLRRPPALQPPTMDGVWAYPQPSPGGVVATRTVDGVVYDIYVAHQIVFPLTAGVHPTRPAILKYSVPLGLQFFSQEEHFEITSDRVALAALPLPAEGRPAGFAGTVGRDLRIERSIGPGPARVGEAVAVEYVVSGAGNLALWPAPELKWPAALRAYVDRIDERPEVIDGVVQGTKRFRYVVVPDSSGSFRLPAVSYDYYDPERGAYATARVPAGVLPVAASGETASRTEPPPLMDGTRPALARRVADAVPGWLFWALWTLAPLATLLVRLRRRPRRRAAEVPAGRTLEDAERMLDRLLRQLVPDFENHPDPDLVAALRAAGVEAPLAAHVVDVHARILAARYGPEADAAYETALVAEVESLVGQLGDSRRGAGRRRLVVASVALCCAMLGAPTAAQAPGPEALYRTGAVRAAALGFIERAEREPAVAAHWYNAGAALYRSGEDARAQAAWLRASRLAPREARIQRALRLVPPDVQSRALVRIAPFTPEEFLLAGTLLWVAAWAVLTRRALQRRALQRGWGIAALAGLALAALGIGVRLWYDRPLALTASAVQLRVSPHGRAPLVTQLASATAVRLERSVPGWVMVRAAGGAEGWLPASALAPVSD